MNAVLVWARGNKTQAVAILGVIISWAALAGVPEAITTGLTTILMAILGTVVWSSVTPVAEVVATVRDATREAADTVASQLGEQSVGEIGVLTGTGALIATNAAALASEAALQGLGVSRKDRAA